MAKKANDQTDLGMDNSGLGGKAPKPVVQISDDANQILILAADVQDTKGKLKTLRELQHELLEQLPEYQELEKAKLATKGAEDKLRIALSDNGDYNDRQERINDEKHKLTDQEDILSMHLIAYRDATSDNAIEVADLTERPIVLKAKLGKERDIQTEFDFNSEP
jgi:hypothetical protein